MRVASDYTMRRRGCSNDYMCRCIFAHLGLVCCKGGYLWLSLCVKVTEVSTGSLLGQLEVCSVMMTTYEHLSNRLSLVIWVQLDVLLQSWIQHTIRAPALLSLSVACHPPATINLIIVVILFSIVHHCDLDRYRGRLWHVMWVFTSNSICCSIIN